MNTCSCQVSPKPQPHSPNNRKNLEGSRPSYFGRRWLRAEILNVCGSWMKIKPGDETHLANERVGKGERAFHVPKAEVGVPHPREFDEHCYKCSANDQAMPLRACTLHLPRTETPYCAAVSVPLIRTVIVLRNLQGHALELRTMCRSCTAPKTL